MKSITTGYRDYGHDIDNLDTLYEVGLGFTANYKKKNGFVGDKYTSQQKDRMKNKKGM